MQYELPPDKRTTSDDALLADLRKCAVAVAPLSLTKDRYNEHGVFSAAGIQRRFGSWNAALERAGVGAHKRMNVERDELLNDLRSVAGQLQTTTLSTVQYNELGRFNASTIARKCGSWAEALKAAGLQPSLHQNFHGDDEQYFEIIEIAWQKLGRCPKEAEIRRPEYAVGGSSIARHFGTWRRALESFVQHVSEPDYCPTSEALSRAPTTAAPARVNQTPRAIGWRLRFLVLRRDGFRCRLCGASPALTPGVQLQVDHIRPWSEGGDTRAENLQSTCQRCNGGKGALPLTDYAQTSAGDELSSTRVETHGA